MAWHHELRAALSSILRRRRLDAELAEEMRFHLEMEAERHRRQGRSPVDADREARRSFGAEARYADDVRDERGASGWDQFWRDVRISLRSLARRRLFTTVVVVTLALGIGATTTLFSVVNAALLAPLPYRQPDGIAVVWSAWKGYDQTWLSWDEYEAWDADIRSFADVGLFSTGALTLSDNDAPTRIRAGQVGAAVFPILGVSPFIGRNFSEAEDRPNADRVVILSHALWTERYSGDRSIVGRRIDVDGAGATVIGVMPAGFRLPLDFGADGPTLAWVPLATSAEEEGAVPGPEFSRDGTGHSYYAVARLAPGATIAGANRELAAKVATLRDAGVYSESMQFRAYAVGVLDQVAGRIRPVLWISLGAVALLLLIACSNVAALLLVRGDQRRRELAVRVALGAAGGRLVRLLMTEAAVMSLLGGIAGVGLAALGTRSVRLLAPLALPRVGEARVDMVVLLVALAATAIAALLAGVLPAVQGARVAPGAELKEGGRSATTSEGRLRWRQLLVTGQIALAVVVVVGAGLMIRTVRNLIAIDRGFDGRGVLALQISTPPMWYRDSIQVTSFWRELTRQVGDLPGVTAVGGVRQLPLGSEMGDWGLRVEGYTPPEHQGTPGDWQVVTPGYFETMGLRLVTGRFLDQRDDLASAPAMVVNRTFVRSYIGARSPLGVQVRIGGHEALPAYTIVGVVDDVRHNGLTREVKPQFYASLSHFALAPGNTRRTMYLVVRSDRDATALASAVRRLVSAIDPRLPVSEVRPMDDVIDSAIAEQRFAMRVLSLFGALALLLATVGVFGVVSQVVAQRRQEFGIRAALGATPRTLVGLSLGSGLRQALVGLGTGLVAAAASTRLLASMMYGVGSTDAVTFVAVAVTALLATLLASALPAWQAARRSPATVLFDG